MSLISKLKSNALLKRLALWSIIPANEYRPRLWVKIFLNPFNHTRGRYSIIRRRTKLDVFPFRRFDLGDYSTIEDFSTINNGVGDVIIGKKSLIGAGNVIIGPVQIGNNVILAQNVVISGLNHNYENISIPPVKQGITTNQIIISDNVWIGANSVITAGITIGKHSVIGAGSIVTKDIPAFTVAVGNPANIIKIYNKETNNWEKV
ncbi:MAG TPA: acyltransferase [Daejeonella sp.]|uniref:acyltransferase n=1 Tax=Daejeonella sp. TaxID=2805397 RepID=UPI002ED781D4